MKRQAQKLAWAVGLLGTVLGIAIMVSSAPQKFKKRIAPSRQDRTLDIKYEPGTLYS
jgi:hypothetical protein